MEFQFRWWKRLWEKTPLGHEWSWIAEGHNWSKECLNWTSKINTFSLKLHKYLETLKNIFVKFNIKLYIEHESIRISRWTPTYAPADFRNRILAMLLNFHVPLPVHLSLPLIIYSPNHYVIVEFILHLLSFIVYYKCVYR